MIALRHNLIKLQRGSQKTSPIFLIKGRCMKTKLFLILALFSSLALGQEDEINQLPNLKSFTKLQDEFMQSHVIYISFTNYQPRVFYTSFDTGKDPISLICHPKNFNFLIDAENQETSITLELLYGFLKGESMSEDLKQCVLKVLALYFGDDKTLSHFNHGGALGDFPGRAGNNALNLIFYPPKPNIFFNLITYRLNGQIDAIFGASDQIFTLA